MSNSTCNGEHGSAGYYVYCRAWMHFNPDSSFPFDDFNGLPDEKIVDAIERYVLQWLRDNRSEIRSELRRKKAKFFESVQRRTAQVGCRPMPRLSMDQKVVLWKDLLVLSEEELTQRARSLGVVGASDKSTLLDNVFRKTVAEAESELLRRRELRESLQPDPQPFDLMAFFRGERTNALGCRIAVIAGWVDKTLRRFGDLSPSPMLFLSREDDKETARHLAAAAQRHYDDKEDWYVIALRFGYIPVREVSIAEQVQIELSLENLQAKKSHWQGTSIHQAVAREYAHIREKTNEVVARSDVPARKEGSQDRHGFYWRGKLWEVWYGAEHGFVNNSVNVWTVVDLLARANPPAAVPAKELLGLVDTEADDVEETFQDAVEKEDLDRIHEGFRQLQAELETARRNNDLAEVDRLRQEIRQVLTYVKGSTYRGQPKRLGTSSTKKAANAVAMRLRRAQKELANNGLRKLADHLHRYIVRTDNTFAYRPPNPLEWEIPGKKL